MLDPKQLKILKRGELAWNSWHRAHPDVRPSLSGADISGANLSGFYLEGADLSGACLHKANLLGAHLEQADLSGADLGEVDLVGAHLRMCCLREARLSGATLGGADLREADLAKAYLRNANLNAANLAGADLSEAHLRGARLHKTNLDGANLRAAALHGTILADLDLSGCRALESCIHLGPSSVDTHTLQRSGPLPLAFLRGVGLSDRLIEYLPSLFGQPIQLYSCFISYASNDQDFAERLHADLQAKGVRCWFAPEDMKIGDPLGETIDAAIRQRDKLLLVLSAASIGSSWVLKETQTALGEEKGRLGRPVLFPIRLDDAVMDTTEQWAHNIKRTRHIGDFSRWKDHDAYKKALDRLLRDLRIETA